ncbi:MAG: hypothetical protein IJ910_03390 [Bacteroidaceae bacterium]|nr:hypothetical protein [Bacteroidaceae bacterium]
MNCNVYIFGELSSGYTQYPEDSSSHVLKIIYPFCKAPTQIAIRRDTSMMYYCYIRKLNDNKYFGLSIAVNGYYISRVDELFSLFENTIEKIALQGSFIHFAKDGSLTTSTTILKNEEEEIDTLSENLRRDFETLGSSTNILPQVDYTVAKDSVKEFNALDDKRDIVRASYTYGYTFIYKDKDFNTIRVNSYRSILSQLNEENNILKKKNEELKELNAKILSQKKQFKNVVFLILAVIGCGIGLLFLNNNLNTTKSELLDANNTISIQKKSIKSKDNQISTLSNNIHYLKIGLNDEIKKRKKIESEFRSFKSSLSSTIPLLITDIEIANVYYNGSIETNYGDYIYSYNTMYLKPKITYTGIRTGESITLNVRLYGSGNSSPTKYIFSNSMIVYSGEGNTYELTGWGGSNKGYWSRGSYRYEIWYGSVCLGSKTFTIY